MNKKIIVIGISAILFITSFTGCEKEVVSTTQIQSPEETPSATTNVPSPTSTAKAIAQNIIMDNVIFDESTNRFFNGNAKAAINEIAPLITSAGAVTASDKGLVVFTGVNDDTYFQWRLIGSLISNYGKLNANNKIINDKTIQISSTEMGKYFTSTFSNFKLPIPNLPSNLKLTYDNAAKVYGAPISDSPVMSYTLTGITLSKANSATDPTMSANLQFKVQNDSKNIVNLAELCLEVTKTPNSMFGYSIQSIEYIFNNETQNANFEKMAKNAPENAVALFVNIPTPEQMKGLKITKTLPLQQTKEKIILIPRAEGANIEIYNVKLNDKGEINKGTAVYSIKNCPKDFAVELQAIRPEGVPSYMIQIVLPNGKITECYISYNGKDGNPNIEYILSKVEK